MRKRWPEYEVQHVPFLFAQRVGDPVGVYALTIDEDGNDVTLFVPYIKGDVEGDGLDELIRVAYEDARAV